MSTQDETRPTREEVQDAVEACACKTLRDDLDDDIDCDPEVPLGAGGYMYNSRAKVHSFAKRIARCVEATFDLPEDALDLPATYPSDEIIDGTLGDLIIDLSDWIDDELGDDA